MYGYDQAVVSHPCGTVNGMGDEAQHVTRAVVFALDPSPVQERMLRSYCGAARFAYNWTIAEVTGNLEARAAERQAAIADDELTTPVS